MVEINLLMAKVLTLLYTGSQTDVGNSKNTFTFEFKDGTAEEKLRHYN